MKSVFPRMRSGFISSTSATSILLLGLAAIAPVNAQIVPDLTLPNGTQVIQDGDRFVITEGTQAGSNLFHSFRDFSLLTGETASFQQISPDIANVISRVTGTNISDIDGAIEALQTNGEVSPANFFLINPNGIVFGENASLNVGGSFIATTASGIDFADGTQFRADDTQSSPLLTVSVPMGLQMGSNPGAIINRSEHQILNPNSGDPIFVGLQVQSGHTLALVGGEIALQRSIITAEAGRVELGSVANGRVSLAEVDEGWAMGYNGVEPFGNILLDFADINTRGERGGTVQIQGQFVQLTDASAIAAETLGDLDGGGVLIRASHVMLDDFARISTGTGGAGRGGDLTVETDRLFLSSGAQLSTTAASTSPAGTLIVTASEAIEIDGGAISGGRWFPSGLFTDVREGSVGQGGNLFLTTHRLSITGGGQVSSVTSGAGNAGMLQIVASEIEVTGAALTPEGNLFRDIRDGFPRRSGLFTSTDRGSSGQGNQLQISTERLTLRDGAVIRTGTFGSGHAGDLTIEASDFVEVIGTDLERSTPTLLFAASGGIPGVEDFNFPEATGNGGTIDIDTGELRVRDGGTIAVGSLNPSGNVSAGELQIRADSVLLDDGSFRGETVSGDGGNITLNITELLRLTDNSLISTTAGTAPAGGDGGDITIETPNGFIVARENSDIKANAFEGRGGNITITAQSLFGIEPRENLSNGSDITASSRLGINGEININTPDIDPSQGLVSLPDAPAVPETLQGCPSARGSNSRFINSGRGGVPTVPTEPLESSDILEDIQPPSHWRETSEGSLGEANSTDRIVEATGWMVDENGKVVLVAEIPTRRDGCGWR